MSGKYVRATQTFRDIKININVCNLSSITHPTLNQCLDYCSNITFLYVKSAHS